MTRHLRVTASALIGLAGICLATLLAAPAHADTRAVGSASTAENATSRVGPTAAQSQIILGGKTQSVDPTRYDYVPPTSAHPGTGGIAPMSADGYAFLSAFSYSWKGLTIPVPGSYIYHRIEGSGLRVTEEEGSWIALSAGSGWQQCNVRFDYQNRSGSTIYSTVSNGQHNGCSFAQTIDIRRPDRTVKTGLLCARLFVSGTFRGEQCHNVFP